MVGGGGRLPYPTLLLWLHSNKFAALTYRCINWIDSSAMCDVLHVNLLHSALTNRFSLSLCLFRSFSLSSYVQQMQPETQLETLSNCKYVSFHTFFSIEFVALID